MKVIDLTKTLKSRLQNEIKTICGGRSIESKWINGFHRGLAGFKYVDPQYDDDAYTYSCNLEFYNAGLGIYFRNNYANHLVLIPDHEIINIQIEKQADKINPESWSLYRMVTKVGLRPLKAAKFLMPKEILEENPAFCMICLEDTYFNLELANISVDKVNSIFLKTKWKDLVTYNVQPPVLLLSDQ